MYLTLCGCKQNQKKKTPSCLMLSSFERLLITALHSTIIMLITSHYSDFFLWHSRQSKEKSKPVKILKKLTFIYQSRLISITPTLTLIILDITKPHSLMIYYLATQPTD